MAEPFEVNDETWQELVLESDTPVMVDYWAEWCGPCKMIAPVIDQLADEYNGKLKVAKLNIDENPDTAAALGIRGIPALFIFKDGEVVSNRMGAAPKAALKSWIDESV